MESPSDVEWFERLLISHYKRSSSTDESTIPFVLRDIPTSDPPGHRNYPTLARLFEEIRAIPEPYRSIENPTMSFGWELTEVDTIDLMDYLELDGDAGVWVWFSDSKDILSARGKWVESPEDVTVEQSYVAGDVFLH